MWRALFAVLFCGLWSLPAHAGIPETIAEMKPSIVGVGTVLATRRPPVRLLGTGFVVADGRHVVTNAHVLPDLVDGEKREYLAIFFGRGSKARPRPVEVAKLDREHDLALLRFVGSRLPAVKLGRADEVREGQRYLFTGFPIGAVLGLYPVTHMGMISAISPAAIPVASPRDLDVRMIRRLRKPFDVFQLDGTAYPGNSGSPLYHPETGRVVGVINKVFVKETKEKVLEKPSGITYAIPVRHVRALLQSAGLAF